MRDYGKVHTSFWSSATTGGLSDDGRLLALYLMTSSHTTIAGVFRLPDGYASEDLGWTAARVVKGFAELLAKGFANRCETSKWVWISKHLKWNPPENPNQVKAAAKCAAGIPDDCAWKRAFMRAHGDLLGFEAQPEAEGCETLSEPSRNQKQEQEQEQEPKQKRKPSASSAEPTIPCPYSDIVDRYHEALPSLPKVKLMTPDRQRALRKVWGWVLRSTKSGGERRATTAAEALEWFDGYFRRASENDFLMGRTQRAAEHAGWKCDLDFLLTDKGMKQVIEKTAVAA